MAKVERIISDDCWELDYPDMRKWLGTEILVTRRIQKYVSDLGLSSSLVALQGKYLVSPFSWSGKENNLFNLDIAAINEISLAFMRSLHNSGLLFGGWHMYDSGKGYYCISCTAHYGKSGLMKHGESRFGRILYYPLSRRVKDNDNWFSCRSVLLSTIKKYLPRVLRSLQRVKLPIDLLEVSYTMGYELRNSGKMPFNEHTTVTSGLSTICKENGFLNFNSLQGKTALLVLPE